MLFSRDRRAAPLDLDDYICPTAGHDTRNDISVLRMVYGRRRRHVLIDRERYKITMTQLVA